MGFIRPHGRTGLTGEKKRLPSDPPSQTIRKDNMLRVMQKVDDLQAIRHIGIVSQDSQVKMMRMTDDTSPDPDWSELIRKVGQDRDRDAFANIFQHFAPRIKAFLMKGGASNTIAEECVQDVMATIWQKSTQFDPSRAAVSTWIYTIARNRRIDLIRKQRRPEPEDLPWGPQAEPDQADALALQQETSKLAIALASLPDAQRQLVERAYFGELTHSQIAAETGLPLGTIKSRLRLALDRLRHAMS